MGEHFHQSVRKTAIYTHVISPYFTRAEYKQKIGVALSSIITYYLSTYQVFTIFQFTAFLRAHITDLKP